MRKKYSAKNSLYRSDVDRREENDRRHSFSLNYSEENKLDRRLSNDRRNTGEKRHDWIRYSKWSSVYIGD